MCMCDRVYIYIYTHTCLVDAKIYTCIFMVFKNTDSDPKDIL